MKYNEVLFIVLSFFFIVDELKSQCLNTVSASSNKGGYFDENDLNTYWYSTKSGQSSTFAIDTNDFYYAEVGASSAGALTNGGTLTINGSVNID